MFAVFVNCASVLVGSLVGLVFSKKITSQHSSVIATAAGIITSIIGFQMAFKYTNIIIVTLSLFIGGLLGNWWDIDGKILALGNFIERKFLPKAPENPDANNGSASKSFPYAFLNASVLFCVGAMAILGSFKAGIEHDYSIIYTKSVLDGFMAIAFAAAMGLGTAFSIIPIFLYQGFLTIASTWIAPFATEQMLSEITGVGGALIVMIGINLLELKKIKTANYLPSILMVIFFVLLTPYTQNLLTYFVK